MSRCSSFPPAGYRVSRERYEELIDFIKVLKEKLRKERKKKGKEMMMMREKRKKISEEEVQICDFVKKDFELKGEEDEFSNEKRRRRRDVETESLNQFEFEGSNTSDLISSITEEETSSYDSTGNNNNKTMKTTTRKRQLSTTEEIEYKHLQLEKLFPPRLLDAAAALPPLDLGWLYPDTTKTRTSKEDGNDRRRAEKRQRSESISCSTSWTGPRAQYLHGVDIFALPYVLPF